MGAVCSHLFFCIANLRFGREGAWPPKWSSAVHASPIWAFLAAVAFLVLFAALLFVLFGLENGQPKRQVPLEIGGRYAFFSYVLLVLAHVVAVDFGQN